MVGQGRDLLRMRWNSLLKALFPPIPRENRLTLVGVMVLLAVAWVWVIRPAVREVASGEILDIIAVSVIGLLTVLVHRALDLGS